MLGARPLLGRSEWRNRWRCRSIRPRHWARRGGTRRSRRSSTFRRPPLDTEPPHPFRGRLERG